MELPILNPPVPYIGPVYGRLEPGKLIRIQGTVLNVAYRFDINLQCGPAATPQNDVAMQVSLNALDDYITLNSLQNGIWGKKQRGGAIPIKCSDRFEIIIMCDFGYYKVTVNNQPYCEFPQRIQYDRITHLGINGSVGISQITYESTSGNARTTTLVPIPLVNNRSAESKLVDVNSYAQAPSSGMGISSRPGMSQPPAYEAAVHGNQSASLLQPHNARRVAASHPTNLHHPGNTCPPTSVPYSTNIPYHVGTPGTGPGMLPVNGTVAAPYPNSTYPLACVPGIPPRTQRRKKKVYIICCGVIGTIVFIAIVAFKVAIWHNMEKNKRSNGNI